VIHWATWSVCTLHGGRDQEDGERWWHDGEHSNCYAEMKHNLAQRTFFWHAPLGVHSAKHRHQSSEGTILSHINCFIRGEVVGFQVLLDSVHPCSTIMVVSSSSQSKLSWTCWQSRRHWKTLWNKLTNLSVYLSVDYADFVFVCALGKSLVFSCCTMYYVRRFIARIEEQIHEWKLNTVTAGPPLMKVVATFHLCRYFTIN